MMMMKNKFHFAEMTAMILALVLMIGLILGSFSGISASEMPQGEVQKGDLIASFYEQIRPGEAAVKPRDDSNRIDPTLWNPYVLIYDNQDIIARDVSIRLLERKASFKINVTPKLISWINSLASSSFSDPAHLGSFWNTVFEHNGNPEGGDYLYQHIVSIGWKAYTQEDYVVMEFEAEYLSSDVQEQRVKTEVNNVIHSLGLDGKSDYEKIAAVYNYMVRNIQYDQTLSRFSAYDALIGKKTVCQGFSSLFYRFMLTLGIDCRCIISQELDHAWNIVKLDDLYYLVDVTWDQNLHNPADTDAQLLRNYQFFLKCPETFGHENYDDQFSNSSFRNRYPLGAWDYSNPTFTILQQPEDLTVNLGEMAHFSVKTSGKGLKYQWFYKYPNALEFGLWSGKTSADLGFETKLVQDGLLVMCLITDAYGGFMLTEPAKLTLIKPRVEWIREPEDVTAEEGETVTFSVETSGEVTKYQWYYMMPGQRSFEVWSGRNTPSVSFTASETKNGLKVYCMIRDSLGYFKNSQTATLTVVKPSLAITQQPVDITVDEGETTTFSVKAKGTGLTYQWYYKLAKDSTFTRWSGRNTASFDFTPASSKNGMQLYCVVKDASGKSVTSETITLTVRKPLAITRQPLDITANADETVAFSLKAQGEGLTYQWYYKLAGSSSFVKWSGRTTASFNFKAASSKNGLQVYCIVSDNNGNQVQSETITLTVKIPLAITQQPTDLTANADETVTFAIRASGNGLTYQWYYKLAGSDSFVKWSGRTIASFNFKAASTKNGLQVYCIVSDASGEQVQSETINLTVV